MGIKSKILYLSDRKKSESSGRLIKVDTINQYKDIGVKQINLSDVIFDTYLDCNGCDVFSLLYSPAYVNTDSIILFQNIPYSDKKDSFVIFS